MVPHCGEPSPGVGGRRRGDPTKVPATVVAFGTPTSRIAAAVAVSQSVGSADEQQFFSQHQCAQGIRPHR